MFILFDHEYRVDTFDKMGLTESGIDMSSLKSIGQL